MKLIKILSINLIVTAFCSNAIGEKIFINIESNNAIMARLAKLTLIKKDTFEKTAEFDKRLCEQTYKMFEVTDKTPLSIELEKPTVIYNADKQAFEISGFLGGNYFDAGESYSDKFRWYPDFDPYKYYGLGIFHNYDEASKTYTGKNAFGVSKEVKVATKTSAVLYYSIKSLVPHRFHKISYQSKPDEARRIEKDLRVAVITRIQPPCFISGKGHSSPTIGFEYDISLSEFGITGTANPEWVLYLNSTKEVLKRGKFR